MTPRTGRPTNEPKNSQYRLRLSDNDIKMIDYCCEKTGKSKADILRLGVEKVYNELKDEKKIGLLSPPKV